MPKKKQNRKPGRERDMYSKNYFHAGESLLNVYLDKQEDRRLILSLKNSCPELTEILHRFSAGIAGTGLAVFLSLALKAANGRVLPLSSTKLLSVSFGFGLLWLSWAINKLRDTINCFSKRSKKPDGEVAIAREVVRSVNEILFRAAALMAMAVVRLA